MSDKRYLHKLVDMLEEQVEALTKEKGHLYTQLSRFINKNGFGKFCLINTTIGHEIEIYNEVYAVTSVNRTEQTVTLKFVRDV